MVDGVEKEGHGMVADNQQTLLLSAAVCLFILIYQGQIWWVVMPGACERGIWKFFTRADNYFLALQRKTETLLF